MLGIPTWFLALSAVELHWPEIIQAVAIQLGMRLTRKQVLNMKIEQQSECLELNPVTAVRMFQQMVFFFK